MSDTVKLIIEIPKRALEVLNTTGVDWLGAENILSAVAQGIPLNNVKAKIEALQSERYYFGFDTCKKEVLEILNNIGNTESESK